ncbi:unnamed protein product [Cylindrotheca closterium]|uniref:RAD50-interacting protein 1 n=1 Tax=Cylindrotheca closterium TaxID=2856 RepID=A0AAD2CQJ1_9STRA|nr:unnamed protein product [Cylindrotheca closterium]
MADLDLGIDFSLESLEKELQSLESSLEDLEKKKHALDREVDGSQFISPDEEEKTVEPEKPLAVRWNELAMEVDSLVLAQDVCEWIRNFSEKAKKQGGMDILLESEMCTTLADLILKYPNILEMAPQVYGDHYLVLYDYCYDSLILLLRGELSTHRYPKDCRKLIKMAKKPNSSILAICKQLSWLEQSHHSVLRAIEGRTQPPSPPIVLTELFAPLVQKVRFHFVDGSKERITSTRVDRLPEWLLTYLRENVLQEKGPFFLAMILLQEAAGDEGALLFLNELVRLVQWVFSKRNFFRDPGVAGPQSNPMLLYSAMEHLIRFDKALQQCLPPTGSDSPETLLGCMDLLVTSDEDLMDWWIQREKESMFSTLMDQDSTDSIPKPLPNFISPRAEVFCALIRSTQYKASVLNAPRKYLREVAVPLCSQFVDALHERINSLKRRLFNYSNKRRIVSGLAPRDELKASIFEWIEVINGARLAADLLGRQDSWQQEESVAASQSDHDLARFGRSLERLNEVMIDEFLVSFVETILLEHAKCASYIMMAQHLLATQEWEEDGSDLSVELRETKLALEILRTGCNEVVNATDDATGASQAPSPFAFAPVVMQEQVMERLAHKFMEVAMDVHSMTPEIWQTGARVFARDVHVLFFGAPFPLCQRLLDVAILMTVDSKVAHSLFLALVGLTGARRLSMDDFINDERLFDEAVSMIRAKGFNRLELSDVISVLGRRRD